MRSKVSQRLREGPADEVLEHLYRPRLREELPGTFAYMTAANKAHVLMLHRRRIISKASARRILRAILALERDGPASLRGDPRLEDVFFNYEEAIIRRLGPDVGGQMHTARSRNDLNAAVIRLRVRDAILEFVPLMFKMRRTALERARQYADVVMTGYTHLQPAQPVTFGHYLAGVAAALERDTRRIGAVYDVANRSPLGACALAGTTFPVDRAYLAHLLGFDSLVEHTLDAVASRDFVLELLGAWSIFGVTCGRVAQDFHVWFSQEFGAVDFPDSVAGTSSIMPQKRNPVVLEHLKGKPAHLLGAFVSAAAAVKSAHFTNTIDGNREGMRGLWQAHAEATACAVLLDLILATASPKATLLLDRARLDFSTATDLADALVRHAGMSFRQARQVVGGTVRRATDLGLRADQVTSALVDVLSRKLLGRPAALSETIVRRALDPARSVAARATLGGPAPAEVRRMAREAMRRLAVERANYRATRRRVERARARLQAHVAAFLRT